VKSNFKANECFTMKGERKTCNKEGDTNIIISNNKISTQNMEHPMIIVIKSDDVRQNSPQRLNAALNEKLITNEKLVYFAIEGKWKKVGPGVFR